MLRHTVPIFLLLFLLPGIVRGQLASPGKLSRAHSKLEGVNKCTECHNFGEKTFRNNCLTCHSEIKSRVDAKHGYHYYTRKLECSKCHKEHHGRDFDLVRWNPESFDHRQTGFLLEGKHDGLECRQCHRPENIHASDIRKKGGGVMKKTYLGLSTDCANCHEDEHRGQLKDCAGCHDPTSWQKNTFSHSRARFALEGRHTSVACTECHPTKDDGKKRYGDTRYLQFRGISFSSCTSCHEDHHKGAYGKECTQCHTPAGWKQLRIAEGSFDHSRTDYPLTGRHAAVQCTQCHTGGDFGKFAKTDLTHCSVCHRDYHAGQFSNRKDGGACESCHTVEGFSPSLFPPEKHAQTRFALTGAHEAIPCIRCHAEAEIGGTKTRRFQWDNLACRSCHKDPHAGQFDARIAKDGCAGCHSVESWFVMEFDHSATRFPLQGKHRDLLCDRCHTVGTVNGVETRVFRIENMRCVSCHEDRHAGQFAGEDGLTDCARCHDAYGWKQLRFDHATMSRFPLTGKHTGLDCSRCHTKTAISGKTVVLYRPLDHRCSACHTTGRQENR